MNNVAVKKNFFKLGGADAADEDRIPFGQAVYASTGASMSIIDYLRTWSADPSANFPSFEYVVIGGIGEEADYAAAGITGATDLSGKIAVVNRGTTTFEEKATVAKAHGAKAVIFVNNVENGGSFAPAYNYFVLPDVRHQPGGRREAGQRRKQDRHLRPPPRVPCWYGNVPAEEQIPGYLPRGGCLPASDFSSWGPAPNLPSSRRSQPRRQHHLLRHRRRL